MLNSARYVILMFIQDPILGMSCFAGNIQGKEDPEFHFSDVNLTLRNPVQSWFNTKGMNHGVEPFLEWKVERPGSPVHPPPNISLSI